MIAQLLPYKLKKQMVFGGGSSLRGKIEAKSTKDGQLVTADNLKSTAEGIFRHYHQDEYDRGKNEWRTIHESFEEPVEITITCAPGDIIEASLKNAIYKAGEETKFSSLSGRIKSFEIEFFDDEYMSDVWDENDKKNKAYNDRKNRNRKD